MEVCQCSCITFKTFYSVILVIKLDIMSSINFEQSPNHEYPAIELDMKNVMEHLSNEYYTCRKFEIMDEGIWTNPKSSDRETENCTDLGEISSVPELKLERDEKVSDFNRNNFIS